MSQFTSFSGANITATIAGVTAPTIINTTIVLADSEEAFSLPAGTKRFLLKTRTPNVRMQLSYVLGESGTTYLTILPGTYYLEDGVDTGASLTLYVQSNKASTVVELLSWT